MDNIFSLVEEFINEVSVGKLSKAALNSYEKRWNDYLKTIDKKGYSHPDTDKAEARFARAEKIMKLNLPQNSKMSATKLKNAAKSSINKRRDEQYGAYKVAPRGEDGFTVKGTPERKKWEDKTQRVFRAEDIAGIAKVREDFGGAVGGIDTSLGVFGQQPNPVAGQPSHAVVNSKSSKGKQKNAIHKWKYKWNGKPVRIYKVNEDINMKEIVKVLLQEGIDEETIHEVLDIIEAGPEIPQFVQDEIRKRENAEVFNQNKKAQDEREKKLQDRDKRKVEAQLYASQALSNLQRVVQGKKPRRPVMIKN